MNEHASASTVDAIEKTMELRAAPDRVWEALTDPAELAAWFPQRVDGLEPAENGEGWLVWDEHGRYAIRLEAYEPRTRLVWRWARQSETSLEDGPTTTVEWRLEPGGDGGTVLHLREDGFLTAHDRSQNVGGWKAELAELLEYLGE